jgi:hypothetical protein
MGRRAMWSAGVCVLICFAFFAFITYSQPKLLYPSSETKTTFLRDYDPNRVLKMFETDGYGWGDSNEGSAGEGFVKNEMDCQGHLAIRPQDSEALIINFKNDLWGHLHDSGPSVLNLTGDLSHGYRFDYQIANSTGWVTIAPLKPDPQKRVGYLAPGFTEVLVEMSIHETWRPVPKSQSKSAASKGATNTLEDRN